MMKLTLDSDLAFINCDLFLLDSLLHRARAEITLFIYHWFYLSKSQAGPLEQDEEVHIKLKLVICPAGIY